MTDQQPTVVYLGNHNAIELLPHPDDPAQTIRSPLAGKRCTTVILAPGLSLLEAARDITAAQGVWQAHSEDPAPAWVASTWPTLAQVLAEHYRCELRDPAPAEV